ncbi:alpha/beta fold hydrolase [Streptacidiphilus sp. P02-A3a]|uniref:alpha/beta fold hydrolase n=1 Tax=Streptacidiphilus sp. P02-A3a TaxID=2704468 RepID=UPI0015FBAED2|nr:alpha/beta hydrolase [Streptacidiphilus sp. P02-A3a]QMU73059.1 alpha/beta hydrolase [Streptacidiphilus sp. P02-A3a]
MPRLVVAEENGNPVSLDYQDVGTGDPVVLIHGWPLTQQMWNAQVTAFVEAGHRVVSYDRRGFGRSTQTWEGYDYGTFAEDLHHLVHALDLRRATLVGFSSGGGDIARYLGTHGTGRIARVVLASAMLPALRDTPDNATGMLDDATIAELLSAAREYRIPMVDEFLNRCFSVDGIVAIDEPTRRYALHLASAASPKATTDSLVAWTGCDFRAELAAVDVPALVIHGDSDAVVPFERSGRLTAAAIPGSETVIVPSAPHGVPMTHHQQWNQAVLAFLEK